MATTTPSIAIEDRIRKLLSKSNGGTTAEYATAMKIAVRLANQHGIDLATMAGDKPPEWTDPAAPAIIIPEKVRAAKWERYLVQGLAKHLGCFACSKPRYNAAGVRMTAQVAHGELGRIQTLRTLAQIWTQEAIRRASTERKKASFLAGFISTVLARLAETDGIAPESDALVPADLAKRALSEFEASLEAPVLSRRTAHDLNAYRRGVSAADGATMPGQAPALGNALALNAGTEE